MVSTTNILKIVVQVVDKATAGLHKVGSKITTIEASMKGFAKASKMDVFNKNLGMAGMKMNNLGKIVDTSTGSVVGLEKAADRVNQALGRGVQKIRTFDMRLLSLLFGGMALKRAFGGVLRSIFDTFKKAEDNTSGLSMATTRLSASWEFMKFSIMDALNTDWFIAFIDGIIRVIRWFSQLDSGWKITFLAISGGLFILGTGMMLIGQIKLAWDAIFGMGGFLRSTNTIHAQTLGSRGVLTKITAWAKIGASIWLIWEGIKDWKEGDLAGVFGNLATGVILWTAGLGYAIPFYLVFKGFQFG
ncbi:hypothetical protein LCGC14_1083310, partial [marine sediment metagenome]